MLKKIGFIVLVILIGSLLFLYYGTYSEGTRAGIIMKVSKKGTLIKTWEGQMNLQTFGAIKDAKNIVSETFSFSIEKGNDELIKKLNEASLSGNRVNLHYKERFMKFFWRGDTKVFATGVDMKDMKRETDADDENFPLRK